MSIGLGCRKHSSDWIPWRSFGGGRKSSRPLCLVRLWALCRAPTASRNRVRCTSWPGSWASLAGAVWPLARRCMLPPWTARKGQAPTLLSAQFRGRALLRSSSLTTLRGNFLGKYVSQRDVKALTRQTSSTEHLANRGHDPIRGPIAALGAAVACCCLPEHRLLQALPKFLTSFADIYHGDNPNSVLGKPESLILREAWQHQAAAQHLAGAQCSLKRIWAAQISVSLAFIFILVGEQWQIQSSRRDPDS